jgi:type III restriction enzyme
VWFRPAKGQFQIFYRWEGDDREYQPDFVAEAANLAYMLETKAQTDMKDPEVLVKKGAAVHWCKQASDYTRTYNGKPWKYCLIPHDAIAENVTMTWLAERFAEFP